MAEENNQSSGTTYGHDQWRYYVRQRTDNGKFTAFLSDGNGLEETVATIPDFPTFEEAQNALDGYALKHKFAAYGSTPNEEPKMEQQTFGSEPAESGDSVPPSNNTPEMGQGSEVLESGNDTADGADENPNSENDSENPDNENTPSDSDFGDSENETEESEDTDESGDPLPDGPELSLRLSAFDPIFNTADDTLRGMAVALKTKLIESGELVIKVTLNNYNGVLKPDPKKCTVSCNLKPAKVSTPVRLASDLEIAVEKDGHVIIPEDREHQLSFEETQKDGGTVTVDGQTGLAEHYEGSEEDNPGGDDTPPENSEEPPQDTPESEPDLEGDPNAQEDQPPYSDGEEIEEGEKEDE